MSLKGHKFILARGEGSINSTSPLLDAELIEIEKPQEEIPGSEPYDDTALIERIEVLENTTIPSEETASSIKTKLLQNTDTNILSDAELEKLQNAPTVEDIETAVDSIDEVISVSSSRSLVDTDHNKILMVTSNVTLTIPSTGLRNNFKLNIDVLASGLCTIVKDAGAVVLDFPDGLILEAEKMGTIYRKPTLNEYRGKGEFKA